MPTKQETFDLVAKHLLDQGRPAAYYDAEASNVLGSKTQCKYRLVAEDGTILKCAAGAVIPDDQYSPTYEGTTIADYRIEGLVASLDVDLELLADLQSAHDRAAEQVLDPTLPQPPLTWDAAIRPLLVDIAESHELHPAVLAI